MRIECEKRTATRLKVAIDGDVQEYAMSFLAIYNNVKADKDLLKMYSDYHNGVYVVCENDVAEAAKKFLEQFGTVEQCEQVIVYLPVCYDLEYSDTMDTEFLDIEE